MSEDERQEGQELAHPELGYQTQAVQIGIPRGLGDGVGIPIHQIAAFQFETQEQGASEFQLNTGYSYARLQNPTVKALEERLTALEGGAATVALSTGQAATFTAILSVCKSGDHVVATSSLFGGSVGLFGNILPLMGISASVVSNTPEAVQAAMQPNTRLVWAETIGNPAADIADIAAYADIAHAQGALLGIDNTWGGVGYLCRPLAHGADIVTHSLTKWAGGHGSVMGGCVTVGTRHDLSRNPIYTAGSPSILEARGEAALSWRQRWFGAHQLGMTLSPHSAFLIAQGLETLALRLGRESATALALAQFLEHRPEIGGVAYPGLESSAFHGLAQKYLHGGYGAVLTYEVQHAAEFLAALRVIRIAPNLGDTRTLVVHPWTTTHGRLPEAARYAAGVTPNTIRMSVGLEDVEDLKRDLAQALALSVVRESEIALI
ncbi:PLP-dependent transferase [Deinococcus ruber]|uniref:O-acetylhomoserine (Thiol)-lyase/O-acetylserine (Thiol)-lyase n=1 Tax=Deinococcus ruber TaxID=1848197 RepID=A0A918FDU2_9DEIO|nr:PLP-dependent transferase [Deinococcus ruber]GGR26106.1 O-acetylhomoserine (thiol)-lyase/O-acetylserine (thiol)-lyase [Deinococcus ruber]